MLSFGIDWDDVISDFNGQAIKLANEEYGMTPPLSIEEITSWENTGRASIIKKYYNDPRLYDMQTVTKEAREFINELQNHGDVYICTAVKPEFMGKRVAKIKQFFPDFPDEKIIMGYQKNLMHFDIILDDGPHNILKSEAKYPVLMRRPWNREITGVLAVNNYQEFFKLIDQIKYSLVEKRKKIEPPSIIALVGPSGSNKKEIAQEMYKYPGFVAPKAYSTKPMSDGVHVQISEEDFIKQKDEFVETTMYAGYAYGTKKEDIQALMDGGKYAVMAIDMCGAIALKRYYPTVIVFCRNGREEMIKNILEKNVDNHEKMLRLISIENELKNASLCDYVVRSKDVQSAVSEILGITQ